MLRLAEDGKTRYVIVLAPDAAAVERNAARELASHLKKMSGAAFPIVVPRKAGRKPRLIVGPGAVQATDAMKTPPSDLGDEGFIVWAMGEDLILTGGKGAARGTLYAVYTFLQDYLGCRWWTDSASAIPRAKTIEIPPVQKRFSPAFEYRETSYSNTYDRKWAARNKTNGRGGLTPAWGGRHVYEGFVHTFDGLVPPGEHFDEHPEWYPQIDGERVPHGQLCLTNPELTAFATERVRERLRRNPEATITSVSQNDCGGACRCAECLAMDRREGSPSGALLRFVNAVAEGIEDEFPRVAVDTLAYQYTRRAPRHARPRRNVIVRLCSIECDFLHPLSHPNNADFRRDIEDWARICDRLYVWDYVTNFAHYVQPYPNWYVLGENARFFAEHSVAGLFEQGNGQTPGGEMAELRAWVISKLMWEPARDAEELIAEFLRGYYGRAAPHVDAYMRCVHGEAMATESYPGSTAIQNALARTGLATVPKAGLFLDLNSPADAPYLSPDVLLEGLRHLEAAESAVRGDAALARRVRLAELPVQYVILLRWNEVRRHAARTRQEWLLADDRMKAFRAFAKVYRANRMTHLGESWSHRDLPWLENVCAGRVRHREFP